MSNKEKFTPEVLKWIQTEYESGKSILKIATETHSTEKTISKKLKELGVEVKSRRLYSQETIDVVKERLKNYKVSKTIVLLKFVKIYILILIVYL